MAEVKTTGVPAEKPAASAIPASTTASATRTAPGLTFRRLFTKPGVSPYDEIEWEKRIAQITDSKGGVIFEQKDVEVPKDWSMTATNIVASKYLHGTLGTPERESGVRALVTRVAETIRDWGLAQGYFRTPEDGAAFHDELAHILLRQYMAFNSPVWFNVGCDRIEPNSDAQNWHWNPVAGRVEFSVTGYKTPQCSACFINSVHDSLDSILTLAKTEGMLFKWGSGTGDFMIAVTRDTDYSTKAVRDGRVINTYKAKDLLTKISDATWHCGDPGMQFDTTVNRWHTSKNTARINASNPCSEYMFLDDTACNLASLNLMKYVNASGQFDVPAFKHAVDVTITAQEILVDNASYPTDKIKENSHNFRPLGLGYANLGALLMSMALPYDSPEGRDVAGAITALMCGEAYAQSSEIAERMGPFPGYDVNREPMLDVIRMHRDAMRGIQPEHVQTELFLGAQEAWDTALAHGEKYGYKNSQVTVLAPTGP